MTTANKNNQFKETKTLLFNSCWIRQSFQGYFCELGIASKHGGLLEITLTVPFMKKYIMSIICKINISYNVCMHI